MDNITISKKDGEVLMHVVYGRLHHEAERQDPAFRQLKFDAKEAALRKVDPAVYDALQNLMRAVWVFK